jgi:hypothetical protein
VLVDVLFKIAETTLEYLNCSICSVKDGKKGYEIPLLYISIIDVHRHMAQLRCAHCEILPPRKPSAKVCAEYEVHAQGRKVY